MIYIGLILIVVNQAPAAGQQPGEQPAPAPEVERAADGKIDVTCPSCGWNGRYNDITRARQALGAHRGWCNRRSEAAADAYRNPFRDPVQPGMVTKGILSASPDHPAMHKSPLFGSGRVITAGVTRATCQRCGWTREYDTPTNADRGLSSHQYSCRQK